MSTVVTRIKCKGYDIEEAQWEAQENVEGTQEDFHTRYTQKT
jgi:hypothetical protein